MLRELHPSVIAYGPFDYVWNESLLMETLLHFHGVDSWFGFEKCFWLTGLGLSWTNQWNSYYFYQALVGISICLLSLQEDFISCWKNWESLIKYLDSKLSCIFNSRVYILNRVSQISYNQHSRNFKRDGIVWIVTLISFVDKNFFFLSIRGRTFSKSKI